MGEPILDPGRQAGMCVHDGSEWRKAKGDTDGRLVVDTELVATTPTIYNVTMTLANTEYSQALPANTRKFLIKCRTSFAIKLAFVSGQSGTNYITIPADQAYWEDHILVSNLTLYFQCATAGQVAEIIVWIS